MKKICFLMLSILIILCCFASAETQELHLLWKLPFDTMEDDVLSQLSLTDGLTFYDPIVSGLTKQHQAKDVRNVQWMGYELSDFYLTTEDSDEDGNFEFTSATLHFFRSNVSELPLPGKLSKESLLDQLKQFQSLHRSLTAAYGSSTWSRVTVLGTSSDGEPIEAIASIDDIARYIEAETWVELAGVFDFIMVEEVFGNVRLCSVLIGNSSPSTMSCSVDYHCEHIIDETNP